MLCGTLDYGSGECIQVKSWQGLHLHCAWLPVKLTGPCGILMHGPTLFSVCLRVILNNMTVALSGKSGLIQFMGNPNWMGVLCQRRCSVFADWPFGSSGLFSDLDTRSYWLSGLHYRLPQVSSVLTANPGTSQTSWSCEPISVVSLCLSVCLSPFFPPSVPPFPCLETLTSGSSLFCTSTLCEESSQMVIGSISVFSTKYTALVR